MKVQTAVELFALCDIPGVNLVLHEPVPWPIYDQFGRLLMAHGAILQSENQLNILYKVGHLHTRDLPKKPGRNLDPVKYDIKANPFIEFDDLCQRLKSVYERVYAHKLQEDSLIRGIYDILLSLQGLYAVHHEALLGIVHLGHEYQMLNPVPYTVVHALRSAIIAECLLQTQNLSREQATLCLAATLTCNLSLYPYQDKLHQKDQPLSEDQRRVINQHPQQSIELLCKNGLDDADWFNIIRLHHYRPDGQGYPQQLNPGESLPLEAELLALAQTYTALLTPRAYRPAFSYIKALKYLSEQRGIQFNDVLARKLIKTLGHFPAGVFVRLCNTELAVVIGRTDDPQCPLVASVIKPDGERFAVPRRRDTRNEEFKVCQVAVLKDSLGVNPSLLWGIEAKRVA